MQHQPTDDDAKKWRLSSTQRASGVSLPPAKKLKRPPSIVAISTPTTNKPKRPLSAYNLFFRAERARSVELARREESDFHALLASASSDGGSSSTSAANRKGAVFQNLARRVAARWNDLPDDERAPYEARAAADRLRYDRELIAWRLGRAEQFSRAVSPGLSSSSSVSVASLESEASAPAKKCSPLSSPSPSSSVASLESEASNMPAENTGLPRNQEWSREILPSIQSQGYCCANAVVPTVFDQPGKMDRRAAPVNRTRPSGSEDSLSVTSAPSITSIPTYMCRADSHLNQLVASLSGAKSDNKKPIHPSSSGFKHTCNKPAALPFPLLHQLSSASPPPNRALPLTSFDPVQKLDVTVRHPPRQSTNTISAKAGTARPELPSLQSNSANTCSAKGLSHVDKLRGSPLLASFFDETPIKSLPAVANLDKLAVAGGASAVTSQLLLETFARRPDKHCCAVLPAHVDNINSINKSDDDYNGILPTHFARSHCLPSDSHHKGPMTSLWNWPPMDCGFAAQDSDFADEHDACEDGGLSPRALPMPSSRYQGDHIVEALTAELEELLDRHREGPRGKGERDGIPEACAAPSWCTPSNSSGDDNNEEDRSFWRDPVVRGLMESLGDSIGIGGGDGTV